MKIHKHTAYLIPKRYNFLFASGEVVHEIFYATKTERWVIRQLFPWLDRPRKTLKEINERYGEVDQLLLKRFLEKITDNHKTYSFYFRSAKQNDWILTEDKYIHELIAVKGHDKKFISKRNFYSYWEIFNLPSVFEMADETSKFIEEFSENHSLYMVDENSIRLYPSVSQMERDIDNPYPLSLIIEQNKGESNEKDNDLNSITFYNQCSRRTA